LAQTLTDLWRRARRAWAGLTLGPWSALALVCLLAAAAWLGAPAKAVALAALAGLALWSHRSGLGGLCLLLFLAPFFLGEAYRPWHFLFGLLAVTWLVCASLGLRRRGAWPDFSLVWPLILLLISAMVSLPLMAREMFWAVWAQPAALTLHQIVAPSHVYPLFGLSHLLDICLVVAALPVMTAVLDQADQAQRRQARDAGAAFVLLYCLGSLLLYALQPGGSYLGASLAGQMQGAIAGFTYNRAYFGTWLVWCLPLLAWIFWPKERWGGGAWLAAAALLVALGCLGLNGQRSNLLAVMGLTLAAVALRAELKWPLKAAIVAAPAAALLCIDVFFLHGFLWEKIVDFSPGQSPYAHIWRFAVGLWRIEPILGVGVGSHAWWYDWPEAVVGGPTLHALGNAHSQYLQVLGEQGLLGLACLFTALAYHWACAWRGWRAGGGALARTALLGLTVTTIVAATQTFAHLRAFGLSWCFYLALALAARPAAERWRLGRRGWLIVLLTAALLLGGRAVYVFNRPPMADFRAGFYTPERFDGGRVGSWMGRRAVWFAPPEPRGRRLRLEVAALLPGLDRRPQGLEVRVDGQWRAFVTLPDRAWRPLTLDLPPGHEPPRVEFRAAHVVCPARDGWSPDQRWLGVIVAWPPPPPPPPPPAYRP